MRQAENLFWQTLFMALSLRMLILAFNAPNNAKPD
jgi:hypothetical protein